MLRAFHQLGLTLALAIGLWVVPSFGTQGMGTIGQRFSHVDRGLVVDLSRQAETGARLRDADRRVIAALPR